jgi:peptide/nickel transport system substrate-binding protein
MLGRHETSPMPGRRRRRVVGIEKCTGVAILVATAALLAALSAGIASGKPLSAGKVGGTLTVATPGAASGFDPSVGSSAQTSYTPWAYDPLIVWAPDGSFKPGLALSWSYGPRNKSFSLKLRPGVRFSDGTAFNAAALKTWFNYAATVPGGGSQAYLKGLTSIKVTGPLSLTLIFNTPTPLLPAIFSQVFTVGMPASPKAVQTKTLATATAGAGEYMLDQSQSVTGDHYTYVPNPYYWNKSAIHWKTVVVKVIANPSTVLQALKTGQVQVAIDQPVSSVAAAKSAGLRAVTPLVLMMTLSLMDRSGKLAPPLADIRVRQALNYAVDRKAVAQVIGAGYGRPITQMAVPGDDGHDPALDKAYPYNPGKAKQLLTAAGYPNGFTFSAVATPVVGLDTFGQALVGQFAKVGVKLNLDVKDPNGYGGGVFSASYPAATISWGRLPSPIQYNILWGPAAGFGNPFKSTNAELSKLYYKMIEASPAQERELARATQKVLVQQAWFVPVFANPLVVLHRADVAGVIATSNRDVYYAPEIRPA